MPKNYKLISHFDGNDEILISVEPDESPETVALSELGWSLVCSAEDEDED